MQDSSADRPQSFAHRMGLLKQGEHLCSVYGDSGEMLTQVVPYLKAGLLNGERCIYVVDDNKKDLLVQALKFWGVDADLAMSSGQLAFWNRADYRQPGPFDLNTMLDFVQSTLDRALVDGHTGIRLAVEMTWALNNGISDDDLVRWEDLLNTISNPGRQVSFICQYNSRLFSSRLIAKAVHVHPVVVLGQDICPNRYYRSASEVLTYQDNDNVEAIVTKLKTSDLEEAAL